MEIIDVISQVPGFNINGKKGRMKKGYKCETYDSESHVTLYEWAQKVSEEILTKNNIDPLEIGVIINSSIGLYETTTRKNTSAPGIGYHVQKRLDATNAFVFEIFHNDWGNIIQIASNFMKRVENQYALLMQTNKFTNTLKDHDNGFSIPDGISIMLIKKSNVSLQLKNYHISSSTGKKAGYEFNGKNKELLQQEILFRLCWKYDEDYVKETNKQLDIISDSLQKEEIPIIIDHWFETHGAKPTEQNDILAMHTIPLHIQTHLDHYKSLNSYAMVSFNPFSNYYSVLKISKNAI